jgi:hypothetical protein
LPWGGSSIALVGEIKRLMRIWLCHAALLGSESHPV